MRRESCVNITRINNFEYSFKLSNKDGLRHVCKALTFRNPSLYAYNPNIEQFNRRNLTFRIGMLSTLIDYLIKHNISYKLSDYEFHLPENITIDDRMSGKYIHQRKAVETFFKRRFGIIVVPTRGGKTFIASEILRIFLNTDEGNFLFLTDNTTLFSQAVDDIKKYFDRYGGTNVGEIRSGKLDVSNRVTVGMIQTIQSTLSNNCKDYSKKKIMQNYLKTLSFLCVDEIHDNCSDSKLKIYKRCLALRYQLCLSATPYRANTFVQNLKLQAWSGDIIYTITEETLRERGVLSDYKVFMLLVDHNDIEYEESIDDNYADYRKKLIFENNFRNNVLKRIIDELRILNLKTLVLFQSVEHGKIMSELLNETFISGATKGQERESVKTQFLQKEGGILLASNIFKKGVTLPEVQVIINADEGVEDANTIQKKGRVLGATETKKRSLVIDFFDVYDAYFSDHSNTRLNTYINAIGKKRIGILDVSADRWLDTFVKWTKKWFEI